MDVVSRPVLPGTYNSRDLGGHEAETGTVRAGLVFRLDAPVALGDRGREVVRALGIRAAIDLREPVERQLDPPELDGLRIDVVHHPILGPDFGMHDASLATIYDAMLRTRGERFAAVIGRLADPGAGPTLIFCSAGKDRTGLTSALLLGALGVADDAIVADYHQTELNMTGPFRTAIVARAVAAGITDQELAAKVGAPPDLMLGCLGTLRDEYGGAAGYLERHGLDAGALDRLRGRLIAH